MIRHGTEKSGKKVRVMEERPHTVFSDRRETASPTRGSHACHGRHARCGSTRVVNSHRPYTAATILGRLAECDRVQQVKREPTRCPSLESPLGSKHHKPPPWQKHVQPLVPFVVGPGYILSRSKAKYTVNVKDHLFEAEQEEKQKKQSDAEREILAVQLQQQISDLTLYLEEERLNHKQTKQRAEEYLKDRLDQVRTQQQKEIREIKEHQEEEVLKLKTEKEEEFSAFQNTTEEQISKLAKEVEFLQGAFEAYKGSLQDELHDKWKAKEDEAKKECDKEVEAATAEMKAQLAKEKATDKADALKSHRKAMDTLRKEHKKEMDSTLRMFSKEAADMERLQRATTELDGVQTELEGIKSQYEETSKLLSTASRTLTDMKVKLMDFEERFQEKVAEVDDKYKFKLLDLHSQNSNLKRRYADKCGELLQEQITTDTRTRQEVQTAKTAMEKLIKSKHKSETASNTIPVPYPVPGTLQGVLVGLRGKGRRQKERPASAPGTEQETQMAHVTAGKTDHLHKVEQVIRPDHIIPAEDPEVEKLREELFASGVRQFTKEDLLKALEV